ncbi:LysR substrate-binding domain-containing protein [Anaerovibrio sp.]|uniref:LysR family transcriptional regulator substrate-binding protein n=1 Tax=Anaerovibrio sp. TaxID=1872532 RepID=UPI003F146A27
MTATISEQVQATENVDGVAAAAQEVDAIRQAVQEADFVGQPVQKQETVQQAVLAADAVQDVSQKTDSAQQMVQETSAVQQAAQEAIREAQAMKAEAERAMQEAQAMKEVQAMKAEAARIMQEAQAMKAEAARAMQELQAMKEQAQSEKEGASLRMVAGGEAGKPEAAKAQPKEGKEALRLVVDGSHRVRSGEAGRQMGEPSLHVVTNESPHRVQDNEPPRMVVDEPHSADSQAAGQDASGGMNQWAQYDEPVAAQEVKEPRGKAGSSGISSFLSSLLKGASKSNMIEMLDPAGKSADDESSLKKLTGKFKPINPLLKRSEYARYVKAQEDYYDMQADAQEDDEAVPVTATLNVGIPETLLMYRVPEFLKEFSKTFPHIGVSMNVYNSVEVTTKVASGMLDVGIHYNAVKNPLISTQKLLSIPLVLVGSPYMAEADRDFITGNQKKNVALICFDQDGVYERLSNIYLSRKNIVMEETSIMKNIEAIKSRIVCNKGVAVLPRYAVEKELANGTLIELKTDIKNCSVSAMISINERRWISEELSSFVSAIQKFYRISEALSDMA